MEEPAPRTSRLVDAVLGVAAIPIWAAVSVTKGIARATAPIGRVVLHPPIIDKRLHPARAVDMLADRGRRARVNAGDDLKRLVAVIAPAVVQEVLNTLDLNAIVHERVDIDDLVATVDIEAIINRVDIDDVVRRVDLDAIVDRIDIDIVAKRLDIDAVADRIDLDRIVERLDLDKVVARVDIDAVIDRVDLVALAEEIIDGIDLPEIIRESTGSMTSEVVRDVRIQSIEADERVTRIIDRLLRRGRARQTDAPGEPESLAAARQRSTHGGQHRSNSEGGQTFSGPTSRS
jgi:hypothetical protein